jgi:hypothetical protein
LSDFSDDGGIHGEVTPIKVGVVQLSRPLSSKQSFNLPETHQGGDQNSNNKSYDVGHGLLPSTYKYD